MCPPEPCTSEPSAAGSGGSSPHTHIHPQLSTVLLNQVWGHLGRDPPKTLHTGRASFGAVQGFPAAESKKAGEFPEPAVQPSSLPTPPRPAPQRPRTAERKAGTAVPQLGSAAGASFHRAADRSSQTRGCGKADSGNSRLRAPGRERGWDAASEREGRVRVDGAQSYWLGCQTRTSFK